MTMCLSNSQDDDSMVRFSIEKHGISVLSRPHFSGRACEPCYRGVRASRVTGACVRVLLKVGACFSRRIIVIAYADVPIELTR
jgi:hypothetical protein